MGTPLAPDLLQRIHAYWRAANYLSVGQIYLMDNPLLKTKLRLEHVKPRLLGHWGTTPGLNFIYVHLNRLIKAHDLSVIYITGPGHGGPGIVANTYLEGTYSEIYPHVPQDEAGLKRLFTQFSFPGGIPSHAAPETPGSIHEGGELGYALSHAYGAAFDNPDLLVAAVVGDGEAETGPLATSWHSNKFLNPVHDGAVLPILHLNGYKIAGPTVLARLPHDELDALLRGYGHAPRYVEGHEPELMHQKMAEALDECLAEITRIQKEARAKGFTDRPRWPVIVLRSPKGWTGPKVVDGEEIEGTFRSHQVPLAELAEKPEHLEMLEQWMKSYKPEELFDGAGRFKAELQALAPTGPRRMGANPHANGGALRKPLKMPDFRKYAVGVPSPGGATAEATRVQGQFVRDVLTPGFFHLLVNLLGERQCPGRLVHAVVSRCRLPADGDILVPHGASTIIGTTDTPVGDPDDAVADGAAVRAMAAAGDELVPGFSSAGPVRAWAAVRPLVGVGASEPGGRQVSRSHRVIDHGEHDGVAGLITVTGGKATTFRLMAEEAVDAVCAALGSPRPCRTALEELSGQ